MKIISIISTVLLIIVTANTLSLIYLNYKALKVFGVGNALIGQSQIPFIIVAALYLFFIALSIFFNVKKRYSLNIKFTGITVVAYFILPFVSQLI